MRLTTTVNGYSDTSYSKQMTRWVFTSNKWYNGDLVIEEKVTTLNNSVNDSFTTRERIDCYVFMDFKSHKAAEYLTFNDTAKVLQTFNLFDSAKLTAGNVHVVYPDTTTLSSRVSILSDTVVNNILYKRFSRSYTSSVQGRPPEYVQIYYLRPDLQENIGRIFFWRDSMTRKLKAPIVWAEEKPSVHSPIILMDARISFLADTLSKQEQKVFDTWKANMNK